MSRADGSLTFSMNVDNSKAVKELNKVEQKIKELENEYNRLASERDAQVQSARQQEGVLDKELALLQEMRAAPKGTYETDEIADQAVRVRGLRAEYNATERSVERINDAMGKTEQKIGKAKTRAGELTEEITRSRSATARLKEATAEADKRMEKFSNRVKGLAKRVFVFSLITSALRAMKDWFGKVIKSNKEASAAIAKLKGALLTLVQPLVNVIIPAFITLVNVLTRIVNTVAALVAKIFGTTAAESAKAAEALYNEAEALESTGNAAKKAGKQLAGFDEINQLVDDSSTSGSSIAPDFSGVVGEGLGGVATLFSGMALVALGAVLTFTGANILLGLGLMAAGAAMVYNADTSDTNSAAELTERGLDVLMGVIGLATLAIGAVLTFTGASIPVGLAMMVAGGLIEYGTAKDDKDGFSKLMSGRLGEVFEAIGPFVAIIGIALLVFGHFFIGLAMVLLGIELFALGKAGQESEGGEDFSQRMITSLQQALHTIGPWIAVVGIALTCLGHFVTGIAMILSGVAIFKIGDESLDWTSLGATLKEVLSKTLEDVGLFVATIGILLCCVGQFAKGLALILFGYAAFKVGKVIETDWGALGATLSDVLALTIVEISAFCIVIGILLCFVPGMLAHGIGLIIAGLAAISYTATTPSWGFVISTLKQRWEEIKLWFKEKVQYYLSSEYWEGVGKAMLDGLLHPFESWGAVKKNNPNFTGIGPDYTWMFKSKSQSASFAVPELAAGTVVPKNREFLAVLGDNKKETEIVSPVSTMKQTFLEAMRESGGTGGVQTIIIKPAAGLTRYLKYELDEESTRQGTSLVGGVT